MKGFSEKIDRMKVVLEGLLPDQSEEYVTEIVRRVDKLSVKVPEGEGRVDTQFPFELLEHLIGNSNNVWKTQTQRFKWL
jgi:hypothetical protein